MSLELTYLDLYENCQILNVTNFPDEINLEENQLDINYRVSALDTGSIYVTSDQFNKKYNVDNEQNKFSIIHINCRSLNANFGEINNLLLDMNFKFDIIAMTETWFNSKTDYDLYQIDGYKMFVCNREFQQGGGVIIYVLDSYSCKKLDNLSYEREDLFEVVTVEILSHRNKSVNIGCMYRKPSSNLTLFNEAFCEYMNIMKNKLLYLCGDYNIDLLKHKSHHGTEIFLNNLFSYGMFPLINKPSRITQYSSTLIDNIFTNDVKRKMESGLIISDVTDHLPIYSISLRNKLIFNKVEECTKPAFRLVNVKTLDKLNEKLGMVQWNQDIFQSNNVDDCYNVFLNTFSSAFKDTCPEIKPMKVSVKKSNKPWMNKSLINSCKKKNSLYGQYLKTKSDKSLWKYKKYKNKLTSILRLAENHYYTEELNKHKGNIKGTWNVVNLLMNKVRKDQSYASSFISNGKLIHNKEDIANEFNEFFTNIGPNLEKNIPNLQGKHFSEFITKRVDKSIFLKPVTDVEIINLVKSFKSKHSCGYDDISMYIIKHVILAIVKPLTYICNISLSNGVFPNHMKIAKIIPVFKNGDQTSFNNYRPISLLPQFSKILEKIFNNRLLQFIDKNNILFDGQYGFRQNFSTELAILEMVEKLQVQLIRKKYLLVYL